MRTLAFDPEIQTSDLAELVNLDRLLMESDIVVTAVPLTDSTRGLISEKELSLMKTGAILINPAMEAITDKAAVLQALASGKLFGFGIETDIIHSLPTGDPYLTHPRILITPHTAFYTQEANLKICALAVANITSFIARQS
jgi:phosphoglycerate dehydrogenase-like enzyme